MPHRVIPIGLQAFAFETITVSSTALGFTAATIAPTSGTDLRKAGAAHVTVETNSVTWTENGTTPTSAIGHVAIAGSEIVIVGVEEVKAFRTIRVTNDAPIQCTFYR